MILNLSVPLIINGPGVITSLSNKAKLFTMSFVSNYTLDGKGQLLPDFLPLMKHKICDFSSSALEVSRTMKSLDSTKGFWPRQNFSHCFQEL